MALKLLFDTSCLIPAIVQEHTHHDRTLPLIQKVLKKSVRGFVCIHSLAECLSTLSKLGEPQIPSSQANELIFQNIVGNFEIVELTLNDYKDAFKRVAEQEMKGPAVYDAIILQAAIKRKVDRLITWDLKDFTRLAGNSMLIASPESIV